MCPQHALLPAPQPPAPQPPAPHTKLSTKPAATHKDWRETTLRSLVVFLQSFQTEFIPLQNSPHLYFKEVPGSSSESSLPCSLQTWLLPPVRNVHLHRNTRKQTKLRSLLHGLPSHVQTRPITLEFNTSVHPSQLSPHRIKPHTKQTEGKMKETMLT